MKRIFCWSLVLLILVPVLSGAADITPVLIAVSVDEKTQPANVSSQAARCAYFMMFDSKGKLLNVVDNPHTDERGGAGTSAANFLHDKGITIVIAETFGDKMINAMKSKGMNFIEYKGKAGDAVKEVLLSPENISK